MNSVLFVRILEGGGTFLLVLPYIRDVKIKSLGTIPNLVNSTDVNTDVYIYSVGNTLFILFIVTILI